MLCLFYVISLVTFFAPWIGNDGYYYYAFTRSVVIDGDIQLANEFRFNPNHYDVPHVHGLPSPTARTDDGYAPSGAPVGTSLLWIPFFLLAHGIAFVANMLGFPISMNGYSLPYLALVGWGSTLYAFLALTLTYLICRDYFSKAASLLAVLALWFGSSLFDYMYLETTMSHSADLFVAALFLYVYCRTERVWGIGRWTLLGLLGGLLAITRFQNVVYLVVPGLLLIRELAIGLSRARWDKAGEAALKSATFALYFAIPWILETILFRALVTKDMVGRLLGPEGMFAVSVSQVVEALFSMRDGLFTITPIVAFAVMGVAFFYRKDRALFFFLAVPALLQLLIASSFTYRFWGPHFGMRYLINPIPLFILGLAALLDKRWIPLKVAAIPIALLSFWNIALAYQYGLGLWSSTAPLDLGMAWSQIFQGIPSRIGQLLVGVSSPDAYIFGGKLLVPSLVRDLLSGWKVQSAAAALGFVALAALTSLYLCKMLFTFEQSRHSVARPAIDSKHAGSTFRLPNLLLPAVALLVVLFLGLTMISPLTMVSAGYGASGPVTGGTPGAYLSIVTPQKFELPTSSGQAVVLTSPGDRLHSLSMSTLRSLDNLDQSGDQVIPGQTKQLSDLEERIFFTSTIAAPHSQVELYVRSKGDGVLALRLGQAGREADSLASTLVPTKELMEGWNTIQLPYNVLEAGKTYFYGLRLASGQQGPELSVDGRAGQIAFRQYYARTPQEVLMSQAAASAGKQVVIGGIPANVTMKIRDDGSGSLRYEAQGSSILLDSVRSQGWQGGGYKGLIYKAGAASGAITYAISSPFPIVGGTASLSIGNYSGEANIQASIAMSKDGVDFEPLPLTIFPDEKNQAVYASLLGQGQKRLFLRFDLTPTSYYFGIDGVTLDLKLDAHGVAAPLSEPEVPWTIQTAGVQGSGIQVNAEVAHRLLYIPAVFEDALGKGARWIGAISYGAWAAGIGILIVALFLRRKKVGRRGVRGSTAILFVLVAISVWFAFQKLPRTLVMESPWDFRGGSGAAFAVGESGLQLGGITTELTEAKTVALGKEPWTINGRPGSFLGLRSVQVQGETWDEVDQQFAESDIIAQEPVDKEKLIYFTPTKSGPHSGVDLYFAKVGGGSVTVRLLADGPEPRELARTSIPAKSLSTGWNRFDLPSTSLEAGRRYFYAISGEAGKDPAVLQAGGRDERAKLIQQVTEANRQLSQVKVSIYAGGPGTITFTPANGKDLLSSSLNPEGWSLGYTEIASKSPGGKSDGIVFKIASPFPLISGSATAWVSQFAAGERPKVAIEVSEDEGRTFRTAVSKDVDPAELTSSANNFPVSARWQVSRGNSFLVRFNLSREDFYLGLRNIELSLQFAPPEVEIPKPFFRQYFSQQIRDLAMEDAATGVKTPLAEVLPGGAKIQLSNDGKGQLSYTRSDTPDLLIKEAYQSAGWRVGYNGIAYRADGQEADGLIFRIPGATTGGRVSAWLSRYGGTEDTRVGMAFSQDGKEFVPLSSATVTVQELAAAGNQYPLEADLPATPGPNLYLKLTLATSDYYAGIKGIKIEASYDKGDLEWPAWARSEDGLKMLFSSASGKSAEAQLTYVEAPAKAVYISPPLPLASGDGKVINIRWEGELPSGVSLTLRSRTSPDGVTWSDWSEPYTPGSSESKSSLGDYWQYKATFITQEAGSVGSLRRVMITYTR